MVKELVVAGGLAFGAGGAAVAGTPARIDFGRDVQPIFKTYCYRCHGPSQQMGAFRLDRRKDAMRGGTDVVIAPGASEGSRLYQRLIGSEYGPKMPMTGALTPAQIEIIKEWIDQGAVWPDEFAGERPAPPPNPEAVRVMAAIRSGDDAEFRRMVEADPKIGNLRGAGGTTTLMYAVLYGNAGMVGRLLAGGADPNLANDEGATALMWAAYDAEKAKVLLAHGAQVNARSRGNRTALLVACGRYGNAAVVRLLLAGGADVSVHSPSFGPDMTALSEAAYVGDADIMKLLLEHRADAKALGGAALYFAVASGCKECTDLLVSRVGKDELSGAAVANAPPLGDARPVAMLVADGADPSAKDSDGHSLLMLAAASENVAPPLIEELVRRGAEVNTKDPQGHTALDFARRRGTDAVAEALLHAGAQPGNPFAAEKVTPAPAQTVRAAVERSLPLLQANDVAFLKKSGCVSCHQDTLTEMTVAAARENGFAWSRESERFHVSTIAKYIDGWRDRVLLGVGIPGDSDTMSYILLDLAAAKFPPNDSTDAIARFLENHQQADGHWWIDAHRPPIEASDFEVTAASMRAIQVYGRRDKGSESSVRRAGWWLAEARPVTTDDRAFQLLGIGWAGADQAAIRRAAAGLLALQRADGGWAQLPSMGSDAYATGETLVALKESGAVAATDAAYQRGVRFLLETQLADGSWYVHSHALRIQPYFESGFPHGRDQFVSAAATNWATHALVLAGQ